jgi:ABC-type antimicrobial peptide transport system permease subunit
MTLMVATAGDAAALAAPVRAVVRRIAPTVPLYGVETMHAIYDRSVWQPRLYGALFATFAVIALVLAAAGVYSVIAYSVTQRLHEIGVRMALGARRGDVFRLVVEGGARLAFVGVAIAAAALAVIGLPPSAEGETRRPARLRSAWRPEVLRAAAVALVGWGCLGGLTFLVAFRTDDAFGLSAGARGLLLTAFGVVGMLTAGLVGRLIERTGARTGALVGGVAGALPVALIGLVPWLPAVALLWAMSGFFAQFLQVGLNALTLTGTGPNPAGAVSVVQAFRFFGASLSPVVFTPVYHASSALGFLLPAALLVTVTPLALLAGRRGRQSDSP